jgi:hypothetical protein
LDVILPDFGCDMMEESSYSPSDFKTMDKKYLGGSHHLVGCQGIYYSYQSDNNSNADNTDEADLRGFLSRLRRDWDTVSHKGTKTLSNDFRFKRLCAFPPLWPKNFAAGKAKSA